MEATIDETGDERHPAFGLIGANNVQIGPKGVALFDSDILHRDTIRIRLHHATRKRDLHHDWIHAEKQILEIELSQAQWAAFVSSFGKGDGVPCSIRYLRAEGEGMVPEVPHDPRLAHSMRETHDAAEGAFGKIRQARDAYEKALREKAPAKERNKLLNDLHHAIENATPNVDYAGRKLVEQAENVVQRSKADIEAMVMRKADELGIERAQLGELMSGDS